MERVHEKKIPTPFFRQVEGGRIISLLVKISRKLQNLHIYIHILYLFIVQLATPAVIQDFRDPAVIHFVSFGKLINLS